MGSTSSAPAARQAPTILLVKQNSRQTGASQANSCVISSSQNETTTNEREEQNMLFMRPDSSQCEQPSYLDNHSATTHRHQKQRTNAGDHTHQSTVISTTDDRIAASDPSSHIQLAGQHLNPTQASANSYYMIKASQVSGSAHLRQLVSQHPPTQIHNHNHQPTLYMPTVYIYQNQPQAQQQANKEQSCASPPSHANTIHSTMCNEQLQTGEQAMSAGAGDAKQMRANKSDGLEDNLIDSDDLELAELKLPPISYFDHSYAPQMRLQI